MSTLLLDIESYEITQEEVEILQHPLVAGLILFTRNFHDVAQLQALVKDIRKRVAKPLLITVDQEGGRVQRFRDGFTQLPAMQAFAQVADKEATLLAEKAGWLMAAEMFAMDIDLSFAPVLDLGHGCKAIGDRSFSESATEVITLGREFIHGMHRAGMAAVGKHFPGHGHVLADSHLETPIDDRSKTTIFNQDILPFKQLISENLLEGVMPAHVIYSQCDTQPASGSSYWLNEVLRKKLGFNGIIFSDDLGMKGAGFMGDFVSRAQQSLAAGCDMLLLCNERAGAISVLDNLNYIAPDIVKQRLQKLYKQKTFSLSALQSSELWQDTHQQLTALQQKWLEQTQV